MTKKSIWEDYYQRMPVDKIPWQKAQADFFIKTIESGKVEPGLALDLGCGVGPYSIYLAKKGFKVTGVDISSVAINYANQNAKREKVKVRFIVADVADLSFLKKERFDFVLDWGCLHGLPKSKQREYVAQVDRHTKKGGKLLLRCFSKREMNKAFSRRKSVGVIYLFSREDIDKLYGQYFKILKTNKSIPPRGKKEPPGKWFDEYLMERI